MDNDELQRVSACLHDEEVWIVDVELHGVE